MAGYFISNKKIVAALQYLVFRAKDSRSLLLLQTVIGMLRRCQANSILARINILIRQMDRYLIKNKVQFLKNKYAFLRCKLTFYNCRYADCIRWIMTTHFADDQNKDAVKSIGQSHTRRAVYYRTGQKS